MASVTILIVSFNTKKHLHRCLLSIPLNMLDCTMVVDNGSVDGSIEMVQTAFPQVALWVNAQNLGYGAAANRAILASSTDYVLLLNSDTVLGPDVVERLVSYLDRHSEVGIVAPRLLRPDGTLQPSCFPFPRPLYLFLEETRLSRIVSYIPILRDHYLYTWSHSHTRVVPWVQGSALAIRREAFQAVNGFDEDFFMYFEEVDLCYRLWKAGWEVHFKPAATVVHVGGGSTSQYRTGMLVQLFKSTRQFYQKHYSAWWTLQLRLLVAVLMFMKIGRDRIWSYWASDPCVHQRLAENVDMWGQILAQMLYHSEASSHRKAGL